MIMKITIINMITMMIIITMMITMTMVIAMIIIVIMIMIMIMIMIIMIAMIMIAMIMTIISPEAVFVSPGMPPMNNFKPSPDTDMVIIFEELLKPASISAMFISVKLFP